MSVCMFHYIQWTGKLVSGPGLVFMHVYFIETYFFMFDPTGYKFLKFHIY